MEQQIVFRIGEQSFAVPITATDKIIQLSHLTKIPDSSSYIMGVMDVQGSVLPIIDLPNRLYTQPLEDKEESQILIVQWKEMKIGLAVDEVLSVQTYNVEQVDYQSDKVSAIDDSASPIAAFIRTEKGIVLALDVERLFAEKGNLELQQLIDFYTESASTVEAHAD